MSIPFGYHKLGIRVNRPTADLPQTKQSALFNVSGRVLLQLILGQVTTVVQTQTCNAHLVANPTTGTDTALCGNVDITAKEAGTLFSIAGAAATAMQVGSSGSVIAQAADVVVAPGTIDFVTYASNTGQVKWSVWYIPLDDNATVSLA